jgi:hypothetical protein
MESARKESLAGPGILPNQLVAAMRAHVVECAYPAIPVTHYENGGLTNREILYEVITGFRDLLDPPDIKPYLWENALLLFFEICPRNIRIDRHRIGSEFRVKVMPLFAIR